MYWKRTKRYSTANAYPSTWCSTTENKINATWKRAALKSSLPIASDEIVRESILSHHWWLKQTSNMFRHFSCFLIACNKNDTDGDKKSTSAAAYLPAQSNVPLFVISSAAGFICRTKIKSHRSLISTVFFIQPHTSQDDKQRQLIQQNNSHLSF